MFTVPDAAGAENVAQSYVYEGDFRDIIVPAFGGTGVVTGCAVTPQGTPDMTLAVAAGSVAVAGTVVAVAGGNVTVTAADGTHDRFDLVCVSNLGVKSVVAGIASANPKPPDAAGKVVLAAVRVPMGATAINANKIVDKRVTAVVVPVQEPTGKISMFAGTVAPTGYLLCDGTAVSRATYATLFALIGTTYGIGDNSTTFNVPDLRGRSPVGLGTHADINAIGKNEGVATLANRRPKHKHTDDFTLPNHIHNNNFTLPTHTHNGSGNTGNQSADHIHSGTTGVESADHVHSYSGNTGNVSADHVHAGNTDNESVSHTHPVGLADDGAIIGGNAQLGNTGNTYSLDDGSGGTSVGNTGPDSNSHIHSFTSGGASANHTHAYSGNTTGISAAHTHSFNTAGVSANHTHTFSFVSGAPNTTPAIDGAVGNPTTNPALGKTIGVGAAATDSTDSAPYLVLNFVVKT